MREILFRGKRLDNGEWAYGSLFVSETDASTYIVCGSWRVKVEFEVEPATIGQYTNSIDENNVKIFEGDIVHFCQSNDRRMDEWDCVAVYVKGGLMFREIPNSSHSSAGHYIPRTRCIVIGNIHDNPDILEARHGTD